MASYTVEEISQRGKDCQSLIKTTLAISLVNAGLEQTHSHRVNGIQCILVFNVNTKHSNGMGRHIK